MSYYQILLVLILIGCKPQPTKEGSMNNVDHQFTNSLINETSPYLLQHAHNPVNWMAWSDNAFDIAKRENKPVIISIGYSSCHWCHVMEHESFENEEVAKVMNEKFICIKVDREERPDVDQVYMDALNNMGLGGGWPLNAITTPDGKPFYGGTYFSKEKWINTLNHLSKTYQEKEAKIIESANETVMRLNFSDIKKYGLKDTTVHYTLDGLNEIYQKLESKFDNIHGGMQGTPKFPMPSLWRFMLRYHTQTMNPNALKQTVLTLNKMALGGLYDQVGGGFTRYSTDTEWFAPHFEKMLYDNGQMVSLYSEAYQLTKSPLYKNTVYQTLEFINREMTDPEGGFYSALDADSEGEEGKFYVWTSDELDSIIGDDVELFNNLFSIRPKGNWENSNILHRTLSNEAFGKVYNIDPIELQSKIDAWNKKLLHARSKKARPGLDDKILLGWNAMMMNGYLSAYRTFNNHEFLKTAIRNAEFIENKLKNGETYFHTFKNGIGKIEAYMDDLALLCSAYINLYQATFDEKWIRNAKSIADYTLTHFYDKNEKMFFYTSNSAEKLITRKKELFDDVVPSSNAIMAQNLYDLSLYFYAENYSDISKSMSATTSTMLNKNPYFMSQWAIYYSNQVIPTAEIAIIGANTEEFRNEFDKEFLPNTIFAGTKNKSDLPILKGRTMLENSTTIYVCFNRSCKLPVTSVKSALSLINKK